ncbi:inositol-3-phosphate synthase [Rhodotorula toruloides NP11]|uniref:Inositol-3-phosphate synthase n=1 Tax=Rhodotorula toruloides (strain NP11) TaxID=1130832 RepID=M7WKI7_RHOT1|nr:inositol-3-phosphate synthase [Rhodotorula toruloides NP11]EMS18325.1 inositol-3-phosphate synthase [Rhodotorula toruloides NP11]
MSPIAISDTVSAAASYVNGASNGYSTGHSNGHSSLPAEFSLDVPQQPVDPTAQRRPLESIQVESPNLTYAEDALYAKYTFHSASVDKVQGQDGHVRYQVKPVEKHLEFKTERKVPKTGLMLVGLGGNNGTTLTATVLANRHNISWGTTNGIQTPNYIGSLVRASTMRLGVDSNGDDVHVPISDVLPMVHPNDLVIGGWDISGVPLDQAMRRAKVLEYDLQRQLAPLMAEYKPLPSIYYPTFINANQEDRADNVIPGSDKQAHLEQIRRDIREFKAKNELEQVVVLWTANTERYSLLLDGVNDTADNLLAAIKNSHDEVSPSTIFAVASILEGVPFINGAPNNALVPGAIALAEREGSFIGGDDFKSGQTKVKSVLAEYLVNAGIKPRLIASYNHLGNNDGKNLSAPAQFRSKEISKASVVDDMVASNHLLYKKLDKKKADSADGFVKGASTETPDHCIVIKYLPACGDSKKAIDDYTSEIGMGGQNTLAIYNVCQDSLLATPLIIDLCLLAELMTRVTYKEEGSKDFERLYSVLGLLSYMLKAPLTKPGRPPINSLNRQRQALEAFLRACLALQPSSDLVNFTQLNVQA